MLLVKFYELQIIKKDSCIINLINEISQFIIIFEKYA